MGRKRQKVVRIVRRKLPEFYLCPNCGKNTIKVHLHKDKGNTTVICASCGLRTSFPVTKDLAEVDAYCLFVDKYYGVEEETTTVA